MTEPASPTDETNRRQSPPAIVAWGTAAVLFLILAWPSLSGEMYTRNDLGDYHLPLRYAWQECLASGNSGVWLNGVNCGYYAHGEGQLGMYHPWHQLLYRCLPLPVAFNIELLSIYPFAFLGMLLFLRRWKLPSLALATGAGLFAFSGFNLLHHVHPNIIAVTAHLPWLLWLIDIASTPTEPRTTRLNAVVGVSLLTASQLLLGAPQAVYLSSFAEALYVVCIVFSRRTWLMPGALATAKMWGVALAAVQVLPMLEALALSDRAATTPEFRMFFSLHPANLLQFFGPLFFQGWVSMNPEGPHQTQEMGLYNGGVATLALFVMGAFLITKISRTYRTGRTHQTGSVLWLYALLLAVLGLWLALGKYGFLYRWVSLLPVVDSLRSSCRHILLIQFASAIAAAGLLSAIISGDIPKSVKRLIWIPVVGAWALALLLILLNRLGVELPATVAPFLASPREMLASPLPITVAAILLACAWRGHRLALGALAIMAILDPALYGLNFVRQTDTVSMPEFTRNIQMPPGSDVFRVSAPVNNLVPLKGVRNSGIYAVSISPPRLRVTPRHENSLRAASVSYLTSNWPSETRLEWSPVRNPMPYARLVAQANVSDNPADDIEKMDVATTALVDHEVGVFSGVPGPVGILQDKPGDVVLQASPKGRQLLVLSETWHPGWKVTANGESLELLRVYGDFMGCILPKEGEYTIAFKFAPYGLHVGWMLSLATLGITLGGLIVLRLGRR